MEAEITHYARAEDGGSYLLVHHWDRTFALNVDEALIFAAALIRAAFGPTRAFLPVASRPHTPREASPKAARAHSLASLSSLLPEDVPHA